MKAINFVLNILLALVVLCAGAFVLAPRFGLVSPFEIKIVRSGSMAPAIPTGSVVFIQPASSYSVGDVITFGPDTPTSVPTSHRIVSIRTENGTTHYTTKGDENNAADQSETPANKVIGRVIFSLPSIGYILAFSKTRLGFISMILIPSLLIICYELIGIVREAQSMRRRKRAEHAIRLLAKESHLLHFDIETPIRWRDQMTI